MFSIPAPASVTPPSSEATVYVPRSAQSDRSVRLLTRYATAEHFKLFEIPDPAARVQVDGNRRWMRDPGRTRNQATGWYRIAYEENPNGSKPRTARFRLSSGHTLGTLAYLSDYLDSTGVPWLYLTNAHGNPLSKSSFRSTAA